jgi:hypothetical protein
MPVRVRTPTNTVRTDVNTKGLVARHGCVVTVVLHKVCTLLRCLVARYTSCIPFFTVATLRIICVATSDIRMSCNRFLAVLTPRQATAGTACWTTTPRRPPRSRCRSTTTQRAWPTTKSTTASIPGTSRPMQVSGCGSLCVRVLCYSEMLHGACWCALIPVQNSYCVYLLLMLLSLASVISYVPVSRRCLEAVSLICALC